MCGDDAYLLFPFLDCCGCSDMGNGQSLFGWMDDDGYSRRTRGTSLKQSVNQLIGDEGQVGVKDVYVHEDKEKQRERAKKAKDGLS